MVCTIIQWIFREISGYISETNFSKTERQCLWDLLGDVKSNLQVWGRPEGFKNSQIRDLSVECQFLMFLMILRRNKTYRECGFLFQVDPTIISNVFKTWLAFVRSKFKDFEPYCRVKRKDLKLPRAFKNKLLRDVR